MTPPSADEIQSRLDRFGRDWHSTRGGTQSSPPPQRLFGFLARLIDPSEASAIFWFPSDATTRELSSGRVVIVTASLIYEVSWRDLPDYYPGYEGPLGSATTRAFSRSLVNDVVWTVATMVRPFEAIEAGEVEVRAENGWSVRLPPTKLYSDADGYFAELLALFGLTATA